MMLAISDDKGEHLFSSLKRSLPHGVNFRLLAGISKLSWRIAEQNLSLAQIKHELDELEKTPHYPRWLVLSTVGLAGAAFCRVNGGVAMDLLIVFIATVIGLFIRQEAHKRQFNPYICIYLAALVASFITKASLVFSEDYFHEPAFATSVLFLIPGVPFINTFSDMIEGNLQNALIRGFNCLIISFSIGMGLVTTNFIFTN